MTKHDLNLCEKYRILYNHVQQTGGSKQLCFNVRGLRLYKLLKRMEKAVY